MSVESMIVDVYLVDFQRQKKFNPRCRNYLHKYQFSCNF